VDGHRVLKKKGCAYKIAKAAKAKEEEEEVQESSKAGCPIVV
jgi:hypothetical protein